MSDASGATRVGVIGAGLMGHAIASVFDGAGFDVRIWDADEAARDSVPARIRSLRAQAGSDEPGRVLVCTTLEETVAGADLIIEAIAENLPAKQELMGLLDVLAPDAIVATNTSVLPISSIAEGAERPDRIVGAHWWNPPHLIPIVEVVRGKRTSEETAARMHGWLAVAGKTPVDVLVDAPGFIGNRMQFALWREAMAIVEQGICDAETVNLVARETFGRRLAVLGPLENADLIGLELTKAIMEYVLPHLSTTHDVSPIVTEAIAAGRVGAASGGGVLDWPEGRLAEARERLAEHLAAQV
jgi:3-hydroxybutyryl-CoA dehydrogenase